MRITPDTTAVPARAASRPLAARAIAHATPQPVTIAAATLSSAQLLQGRKAIEISHNGSVYRLQETKFGKLILTK